MPRLLPDNTPDHTESVRRLFARLRIQPDSELIGRHFDEVTKRVPKNFRFEERLDDTFQAGQRLLSSGTHDALEEANRILKSRVAPAWVMDRIKRQSAEMREDIQVVEIVVTADSRLTNRTLVSSGIADNYGVAVLGIQRPDSLLQLEGAREMPRWSKAVLAAAIMFGSVATASVGLFPIARSSC